MRLAVRRGISYLILDAVDLLLLRLDLLEQLFLLDLDIVNLSVELVLVLLELLVQPLLEVLFLAEVADSHEILLLLGVLPVFAPVEVADHVSAELASELERRRKGVVMG